MQKNTSWLTPTTLLVLMSIAMPLAFNTWSALLNNFAVERAAFSGVEIGILQSLREVPGFLSFTVIFVLLVIKEQTFAVVSLALLGLGVALTGFFPSEYGLYFTTVLMSIGFHYFEAIKQSLSLQWLSKEEAPQVLGRLIAVGAMTSLIVYGVLWVLLEVFSLSFLWNFALAGGLCCVLAAVMWLGFPHFPAKTAQHKTLVLRRRYWLYYLLTFLSGARRQIFVVFAAFLMVEKFGYSASEVTLLFLINYAFNWFFAERIGVLIHRIGERRALTIEYIGLIFVFVAYGLVDDASALCNRSYDFRHGDCDQHLLPENRRSKRHGEYSRGFVHHQSYRSDRHSSRTRAGVDVVYVSGVLYRSGIRFAFTARCAADPFRSGPGARNGFALGPQASGGRYSIGASKENVA